MSHKLDIELYKWKMENYNSKVRECWIIEAVPKDRIKNYFLITLETPIVFERKIR
jgi:hypothetical protein